MTVKILIHNYERVREVIKGVNSMSITRAWDNRIIWADGDICAPFLVVPDHVEVRAGDPVQGLLEKDVSDSFDMTTQFLRLAKRIEELEEREK